MKVDYLVESNAPGLPMIAAAPVRLTMTAEELEAPAYFYDPVSQGTIGAMSSSTCNIDESINPVFNSTTDTKQDD